MKNQRLFSTLKMHDIVIAESVGRYALGLGAESRELLLLIFSPHACLQRMYAPCLVIVEGDVAEPLLPLFLTTQHVALRPHPELDKEPDRLSHKPADGGVRREKRPERPEL